MSDKPEISFGTRIRKSPFFDSTIKWGCKGYTVYNKMYMPTFYKSFVDDYWSLVKDVTLWDVAGERQVEIKGKDAERFIEFITPRDISKCKIGQCMYILLTEKNGGIVNDPVLLKLDQNHFWLSIADSDVLLWCLGIASSKNFDISLGEPDVSPLSLQGPKAPSVMEKLVGSWVRDLKFFNFKKFQISDIPVYIARSGWSGEAGYEIYLCDGKLGNELWEIIMKAGKEFNIAPAAPSQISRIESGMLSYGSDMSLSETPYDINLEKFIDFDKKSNCLSMNHLKKIKEEGPKKRLVGIEIETSNFDDYIADHIILYDNNEKIGKITSSVYSPRLKKNIGLAIINFSKNITNSEYNIKIKDKFIKTKICKLPFLRNK
ncbi:MAG: Dimethylsulfonioproprionate demethylase DmdA [Alphaproteobacteria bacterium MarineAlpha5_Bin9]|nr:MAG: Dimethylsulfonioproprionate demethylase DmdA [Alphaproteobacteria bacterium MarineAlpha5_Bin9]|tara:strand:+ start:1392 stop:2516 length:1125 start_codon:yes stop_codon:yes gene_type:complete